MSNINPDDMTHDGYYHHNSGYGNGAYTRVVDPTLTAAVYDRGDKVVFALRDEDNEIELTHLSHVDPAIGLGFFTALFRNANQAATVTAIKGEEVWFRRQGFQFHHHTRLWEKTEGDDTLRVDPVTKLMYYRHKEHTIPLRTPFTHDDCDKVWTFLTTGAL